MRTHTGNDQPPKKRPVNLTIREDILNDAKELNLNASQAAEQGIVKAIKKAREEAWREENKDAIAAYNKRIAESGPILKPSWLEE